MAPAESKQEVIRKVTSIVLVCLGIVYMNWYASPAHASSWLDFAQENFPMDIRDRLILSSGTAVAIVALTTYLLKVSYMFSGLEVILDCLARFFDEVYWRTISSCRFRCKRIRKAHSRSNIHPLLTKLHLADWIWVDSDDTACFDDADDEYVCKCLQKVLPGFVIGTKQQLAVAVSRIPLNAFQNAYRQAFKQQHAELQEHWFWYSFARYLVALALVAPRLVYLLAQMVDVSVVVLAMALWIFVLIMHYYSTVNYIKALHATLAAGRQATI